MVRGLSVTCWCAMSDHVRSVVSGTYVAVTALSLIEAGPTPSVMNFDTHDKRHHWRNDNTGARARILPDGSGQEHRTG